MTRDEDNWSVLLSGVVDSQVYDLATPESDRDVMEVAAVPTIELFGLHPPVGRKATRQYHDPDVVVHEAGKYAALALKCNPSILELLWLCGPEDDSFLFEERYPHMTALGAQLIGIRKSFLSAKAVRNAYFGHAVERFRRLERRGDGSSPPDVRKRSAKHARHLMRSLECGSVLYATGTMSVRAADPEAVRAFGEAVADGGPEGLRLARSLIDRYEALFERTASPLPDRPDERSVEKWLHRVRRRHLG